MGVDVRDLPQSELRRRMGVILQEGFLFAGDVKSNITLGDTYSMDEIRAAAQKTNVDQVYRTIAPNLRYPVARAGDKPF